MDDRPKVYQITLTRLQVRDIQHLLSIYKDAPSYELENSLDNVIPALKSILTQAQRRAV